MRPGTTQSNGNLNRALQEHCGMPDLKADPLYDSLHDDPGFNELIARLGL
jgi:hypothetical protein